MLKIDREGEEFVFSNDWDILIPVEIERLPETGLTLSVIPRLRAVGRRFLKLFSDRPFSDAAPGAPLPGCRPLTAEDERINRTTFDLAETVAGGRLCFGQIEGGEVVSVAVTHASPDEREPGGTLEIGVETIPEARRRGYAASSLAGLTGAILSQGLVPEYRCTCSNVASAKVARAAGYRQIGEACSFVMRKKGR